MMVSCPLDTYQAYDLTFTNVEQRENQDRCREEISCAKVGIYCFLVKFDLVTAVTSSF
jgi:hypothetical protein